MIDKQEEVAAALGFTFQGLADHSARHLAALAFARLHVEEAGYRAALAHRTGSAFYGAQNPNDLDVLMLIRGEDGNQDQLGGIPNDLGDFVEEMKALGWEDCGDAGNTSGGNADAEDYRVHWCALRAPLQCDDLFPPSVNIIASTDAVWHLRQAAASELCRAAGVTMRTAPSKDDVVAVFRAVREGVSPFVVEGGPANPFDTE